MSITKDIPITSATSRTVGQVQFEDQNIGGLIKGDTTQMFNDNTRFIANKQLGNTVLDISCGHSLYTYVELGMGTSVVALDYFSSIDAALTIFAGKNADVLFVQGFALLLPLNYNSVDYSLSIGVLHHKQSPPPWCARRIE